MTRIDAASLRIIEYPDVRLRKVCKPVEDFDETLAHVTERMLALMHEDKGIGLAAPQVGLLLRLFVCNVTGEPNDDHIYVNPQLLDFEGHADGDEGCLSMPEITVKVRRRARCTMRATDVTGKLIECDGEELLARCWQHECDHLDGRLIVDYMSEADKIANRRVLKQLEAAYKGRGIASNSAPGSAVGFPRDRS